MIQFVTLNSIVLDLLNIVRAANISRSELISPRQVEMWVHQYRSLLIKRDLDKGRMVNPDYVQEIPGLELEVVDRTKGMDLPSGLYLLRTKLELPKTIDLNYRSGFTYIGTVDGREIQFVPESRVRWQQYKKYTNKEELAFLRSKHMYLVYPSPIQYLSIRGIFEVPTEVGNFTNDHADYTYANWDTPYPISENMLPELKAMILKAELGMTVQAESDLSNDAANLQQPNQVEAKQQSA
jgi:hypothetical protein